jgi:hypothetical protein
LAWVIIMEEVIPVVVTVDVFLAFVYKQNAAHPREAVGGWFHLVPFRDKKLVPWHTKIERAKTVDKKTRR